MASRPAAQGPSMGQFEAYFQRADLDRDGRISGAEAVAFFQGSNLPNQILAQIWMYSDPRHSGFLGRPEFYNALRLVTVAQSGRQLTREIVKAALEGPAAAKIPPPKINSVNPISSAAPSLNPVTSPSQMGMVPTIPSQGVGSNGAQIFPNESVNRQLLSTTARPTQTTVALSSLPMQPVSQGRPGANSMATLQTQNLNAPNSTASWLGGKAGQASVTSNPNRGVASFVDKGGVVQSYPIATSSANQGAQMSPSLSASLPPKPPKQGASFSVVSANRISSTSNTAAIGSHSVQVSSSANRATTTLAGGSVLQNSQSLIKQNQQGAIQNMTGPTSAVGIANPGFNLAQPQWPKITQLNIQKYTKVFMEVDKDKDGKITGEEARSLFLSWKLPREVLKQVWDLSDQDGDSMLSLREFCIALYLMERYREGCPLPSLLPSSLLYDEALLQIASQSSAKQGFLQQQGMHGTYPAMSAELKPHQQVQRSSQADSEMRPVQQKSGVQLLEKHLVNQLGNEEQNALNSKLKEATEAEKKVQELEKEIVELNQKIEFFRTKMQELVIYKSKCDNRLNEITERASADKRELDALTKKYEEKCKNLGDVASKLTAEEATFHDIQAKKLELFNAIVKINDGEKDNTALQGRVDGIQSDLDELMRGLNLRCKKYGLRVKPTTLVELPFGWQPGIQENAADWDENWDKFEDEVSGFVLIKELTVDVENVIAPPKAKAHSVSNHQISKQDTSPVPYSDVHKPMEDPSNIDSQVTENDVAHAHSENGSASLPSTPTGGGALESPSHQMSSPKSDINGVKDNQSDHDVADSTIFSKAYSNHQWVTNFDSHDDNDSLWGSDAMIKETGDGSNKHNSLFGYDDLGLSPIRAGPPSAASVYGGMDRPFFDSVPSTPSGYSGFSPRYGEGLDQTSAFSRFDFIDSQGKSGFSPRYGEGLDHMSGFSRFDSIGPQGRSGFSPRYSEGLDQTSGFSRFDSIGSQGRSGSSPRYGEGVDQTSGFSRFDSIGSQGNFSRLDSISGSGSKDFDRGGFLSKTDTFPRFDSFRSTTDTDHDQRSLRFDDSDPFGSGPFRSSESHTPKVSDNWSSF